MRLRPIHILCLLALALAFPRPAMAKAATAPTDEAQRIFGKYGAAIYQVQTIDLATGKKSSIGSGFQFTADGLIASNYHVVSDVVRHPKNSRLEYVQGQGVRGTLKVLAVDVLHDLSILKMEKPGKTFLGLGSSELPKGTRLFSLGNPHDIGFTIIEGTYNGFAKESFADKIHFSGSLNPGMSGGPALSHDGRVVGINVSTAGNQISFLVPVEPLKALFAEEEKRGRDYDFLAHANDHISAQLLKGQERTIGAFLKKKWESVPFGPLEVPGRVHEALKCWGMPVHKESDPFRYYRSICATQDRTFLGEDFDTGTVGYRYDYVTATEKMNPIRFNAFYQQQYGAPEGGDGREDDVTNYDCNSGFVDTAARRWKASFCVRQYKAYPEVYDMQLFMAMVGSGKDGVIASLWAEGVSKNSALALAKKFMSEIREKPPEKQDEKPSEKKSEKAKPKTQEKPAMPQDAVKDEKPAPKTGGLNQ
jgi:serine protease Do